MSAPVEAHIGARIKSRRSEMRISQSALGAVLGVTYQQLQKFESGANRIAASQLHRVAGALSVGLDFFFEGYADKPTPRRSGRGRRAAR